MSHGDDRLPHVEISRMKFRSGNSGIFVETTKFDNYFSSARYMRILLLKIYGSVTAYLRRITELLGTAQ